MAKIVFKNIGREKWCGEIPIDDAHDVDRITELAYMEAKKHLLSNYPDVEYDLNTNEGKIFAGYHCTGEFSIKE